MIRGVSFKAPNKYFNLLYLILEGIDIQKYTWYVSEDFTLKDMKDLTTESKYSGADFEKTINTDDYYIISINLQAYNENSPVAKIDTYNDFLMSTCELAVLICDVEYVEIYAKDKDMIDIIKHNAEKNSFNEIEYITDENDGRTRFYVR